LRLYNISPLFHAKKYKKSSYGSSRGKWS
jgi:hypothetical protein